MGPSTLGKHGSLEQMSPSLSRKHAKFFEKTCVWASFVVRKHVLLGNLGPFAKRKLQFPFRKVEENLVNSPLQ